MKAAGHQVVVVLNDSKHRNVLEEMSPARSKSLVVLSQKER